jgi:hypothetical protein
MVNRIFKIHFGNFFEGQVGHEGQVGQFFYNEKLSDGSQPFRLHAVVLNR